MELSNKARREAQLICQKQVAQMKARYGKAYTSWDTLGVMLGHKIPTLYSDKPFNYMNVLSFTDYWMNSCEARIKSAVELATESKVKITTGDIRRTDCTSFGSVTLFPEQEALFRRAYQDVFVEGKTKSFLQDGETGSGKSFIGAFLIAKHIADGALKDPAYPLRAILPFQYIVFTPKNVVEQYKRVFEMCGLGHLVAKQKILVTSYSQLNTLAGEMFVTEITDPITDETSLQWNQMLCPIAIIWDESQKLNNWKTFQTRACHSAIAASNDTVHIFMSATPWEKVNDSYTFLKSLKTPVLGLTVQDERSFKAFASMVDAEPSKPNVAACKRLREILGGFIYSLPRAKWAHKQLNSTLLLDFDTPEDRNTYNQAHQKYLAVCKKVGKNTEFGRFAEFVALNNFRKTSEPLRAPQLARKIIENYRAGRVATVVGTAFKETIVRIAFELDKAGIPREHFAVIWGGGKQINPADIMSQAEIDALLEGAATGVRYTKKDFKRLKITLDYIEEQHTYAETQEQQAYRHRRMAELKLRGTQSADQRQKEIDAFQSGKAKICLFTLASGGVGLSLDKDKPHLLEREGYFTPVWNGKEFKQALGRTVRRASLADSRQYVCYMRGTVEEYHVAPLLDTKLRCIAEITNRTFDVFDLLAQDLPVEANTDHKFMTPEEIEAAAESGHIIDTGDDGEEDEDDEE